MGINRNDKRGFTLVELMIVVAIVGVLASLAIYGVSKYVIHAKTTEARNSIGQLAKDATTAYAREKMDGAVLDFEGNSAASNDVCASAEDTVPDELAKVKAQKYQSSPAEWNAGSQSAGWRCLKFSMNEPQYFMYGYTAVAGESFAATAQGDLDGDDQPSTYTLLGAVDADTGVLRVAPSIQEEDPEE